MGQFYDKMDNLGLLGGGSALYPKAASAALQGGGGFDIGKLLGGGAGGLGALLGGPLGMIGLPALGQVFSLLSGPSWQEKMSKQGANNLKGMLGKDVFDVQKYIAGSNRSLVPKMNTYGNSVNQRFGLDQGRGQEAFMEKYMQMLDENEYQGRFQNDMAKSQRDLQINQALLSLGK